MEIDNIYNNLISANFKFDNIDNKFLNETFIEIKRDYISFELQEVNKKIEPLEIIVRLISDKVVGDLIIDMYNKDGIILGKIRINKLVFKRIDDLLDFSIYNDIQKNRKVFYECDDIVYISKDGEENKISF